MKSKFLIIFLGVLAFTNVVEAQNASYTLEQCRSMAVKANYDLKSSYEKIQISEDMLASYKTNKLPNLSVKANYLYSTASFEETMKGGFLPTFTGGVMNPGTFAYMPDQTFKVEVNSVYNANAMVVQPIYLGGKINTSVKMARLGVDISELNKQKTEAEVLVLTDKAFYQVKELEDMLLSAQKYEEVVAEFYRQMDNACKQGMKNRNDLMKVSVRLNEAKLLVQKATNGLLLAKMNFCYTIGLPLISTKITLEEPMESYGVINSDELDVTMRPEYEMLAKSVEAKRLDVKMTKSDFLPSVSALASYGYVNGASINDNPLLNGAGFSGGVTVSVPIFHWGEGRKRVSAKQREVNIAQNAKDDLSLKMQLELMQAINTFNESILEVELTNEAVTQAEENMRLSKNQYDAGLETIADYLESQALWQKAMSDKCSAKTKQRTSYTSYLKCQGRLMAR